MNFKEVWEFAETIPGAYLPESGEQLYKHALEARGVIVEVGVDKGKSASVLVHAASQTGARVYLIDTWGSILIDNMYYVREWLQNNFPKVDVRILHMNTQQAAPYLPAIIDMVHIDGDHYVEVVNDCEILLPRLKSGGIAAFHDYQGSFDAVTNAVDKYTGEWENLGTFGGMALRRKP
jgi:predicted O-methyltransferase YrrM